MAAMPIDWYAVAATVNAFHDANGYWLSYDEIMALNATPIVSPPMVAPSTSIGTGPDSFVLKISEDAYNGDAQFTVKVDGVQVGGTQTAHALHMLNHEDSLTLHGNYGPGAHIVTVNFLNDAYAGTPATDRNLHVGAVSYNGVAQSHGAFDLMSSGGHDFAVAAAAAAPVVVAPIHNAGESILPNGFTPVWVQSFDGGVGTFSNTYGHTWAHDGQVDVSSWAGDGLAPSGAMIAPSGASAGTGYGLYSWTVQGNQSNAPGAFMCLWPASNAWPGPELDMAEVATDGSVYSTIHYKAADGSDGFDMHKLDGIKFTDKHTYSMDWQPGRLTGYVDGVQKWTTIDHVPKDYAHGGENEVPGVGEQPAWAAAYQHGDNLVTLFEATYSVHTTIA